MGKRQDAITRKMESVFSKDMDKDSVKKLFKQTKVMDIASAYGLALCGSLGRAFYSNKYDEVPEDIDFVTDSYDMAFSFISWVVRVFKKYRYHGKVYIQHGTDWCPKNCTTHIKIITSLGTNVCVMVLKEGSLKSYYTSDGICMQFFGDMVEAGKELTKRDGKKRNYYVDEISIIDIKDENGERQPIVSIVKKSLSSIQ